MTLNEIMKTASVGFRDELEKEGWAQFILPALKMIGTSLATSAAMKGVSSVAGGLGKKPQAQAPVMPTPAPAGNTAPNAPLYTS